MITKGKLEIKMRVKPFTFDHRNYLKNVSSMMHSDSKKVRTSDGCQTRVFNSVDCADYYENLETFEACTEMVNISGNVDVVDTGFVLTLRDGSEANVDIESARSLMHDFDDISFYARDLLNKGSSIHDAIEKREDVILSFGRKMLEHPVEREFIRGVIHNDVQKKLFGIAILKAKEERDAGNM